jgi:hypothetical protein
MEERRTVSARTLVMGAAIGLVSGLLIDYLGLFFLRFVSLPWPGPGLNDLPVAAWFIPVLVASAILGALYYSAEA